MSAEPIDIMVSKSFEDKFQIEIFRTGNYFIQHLKEILFLMHQQFSGARLYLCPENNALSFEKN